MEIRIIFKQVGTGPPDLRFVEVEDVDGRGVSVGAWSVDKDGFHVLTLDARPEVTLPPRHRDQPKIG